MAEQPLIYCSTNHLGSSIIFGVFSGTFRPKRNAPSRSVAVKTYLLDDEILTKQFLNDKAKDLKKLKHPNLVRVIHCETIEPYTYVALDLCCATLFEYCNGEYTLASPSHMDGLIQVTSGLCYLQSKDKKHGAINPTNILIANPFSRIKFKIQIFNTSSPPGSDETFSPPEFFSTITQKLSDKVEPTDAGDVWSLGCVFYYFLTKGRHPFGGERTVSNILSHQLDLSGLDATRTVHRLIARMLSGNPSDRPHPSQILDQLVTGRACVRICCSGSPPARAHCCLFHPTRPVLFCGLGTSSVCSFTASHAEDPVDAWERKELYRNRYNGNLIVTAMEWSATDESLYVGLSNGSVKCVTLEGEFIRYQGENDKVTAIACEWPFTFNGSFPEERSTESLTGHESGKIHRRWGRLLLKSYTFHSHAILDLVWISQERFASLSSEGVKIGYIKSGNPISTYNQHTVFKIIWKSERLASICSDGFLRLWSVKSGQFETKREFQSITPISAMDWFWDEDVPISLVACGHGDGQITIWNVRRSAGNPRTMTARHASRVKYLSFSPNGLFMASVATKELFVWNVNSRQIAVRCDIKETCGKPTWDHTSTLLAFTDTSEKVRVVQLYCP